jgi:hypothetical protein
MADTKESNEVREHPQYINRPGIHKQILDEKVEFTPEEWAILEQEQKEKDERLRKASEDYEKRKKTEGDEDKKLLREFFFPPSKYTSPKFNQGGFVDRMDYGGGGKVHNNKRRYKHGGLVSTREGAVDYQEGGNRIIRGPNNTG